MKIKPDKKVCSEKMLFSHKEYDVIEISNTRGECEVDLSFKIANELGQDVWIDDWDCTEIPRQDRTKYYI